MRGSDIHVVLRHRSRDVEIFDEIHVALSGYEPPPEVDRALRTICDLRVLDLGGNIGLFGAWILSRYPGASVTSVEPDPNNVPLLRRCAVLVDPSGSRWKIIDACAGNAAGTAHFAAGNYADSFVVEAGQIGGRGTIELPVVDVFPLLWQTDFAKIDIEGSEWPLLLDDRFRSVTAHAVVVEWHQRGCPAPDAYAEAVAALKAAGFALQGEAPAGAPHHGVLWGWRP